MAKTFYAPFAQSPKTSYALVTTAIATLATTAPTNTVLLMTAGAEGSILTRLWAIPRGSVATNTLVLFLSKDSGVTKYPIDSELMGAFTTSTSTAMPETQFTNYSEASPLRLGANDQLYVGSLVTTASNIVFKAEYTDF